MPPSSFSLRNFEKSNWLTVGYCGLWCVLIILNYNKIWAAGWLLLFHIFMLFLTTVLGAISPIGSFIKFLKYWTHFFFLPLFFTALHYLIPAIHPRNLDPVLIEIDYWITGNYPTVWLERLYSPILTEILQLSYLTFYFLPLLILIPLYYKQNFQYFNQCAFSILLTFYLSYLGYLLFPALGPRYFLAHMQSFALDGIGFYHSISTTLNGLENIQWDAFPSGHVAIALVFSHFAFRYYRKIFYFSLPFVICLIISTVYLRYHYLVDVLAGIVLYVLVMSIKIFVFRIAAPKEI